MSSAAAVPADHSAEVTQGVNPWLIAASVMLATFMEVLDTAIASVALPYIAGSLSASNDEATWVLTSYLVANAIVLPASNWCSLRFGRKNSSSPASSSSPSPASPAEPPPSLAIMLLARVVQGAGGGAPPAPLSGHPLRVLSSRQTRGRSGRLRLRSRRGSLSLAPLSAAGSPTLIPGDTPSTSTSLSAFLPSL